MANLNGQVQQKSIWEVLRYHIKLPIGKNYNCIWVTCSNNAENSQIQCFKLQSLYLESDAGGLPPVWNCMRFDSELQVSSGLYEALSQKQNKNHRYVDSDGSNNVYATEKDKSANSFY